MVLVSLRSPIPGRMKKVFRSPALLRYGREKHGSPSHKKTTHPTMAGSPSRASGSVWVSAPGVLEDAAEGDCRRVLMIIHGRNGTS